MRAGLLADQAVLVSVASDTPGHVGALVIVQLRANISNQCPHLPCRLGRGCGVRACVDRIEIRKPCVPKHFAHQRQGCHITQAVVLAMNRQNRHPELGPDVVRIHVLVHPRAVGNGPELREVDHLGHRLNTQRAEKVVDAAEHIFRQVRQREGPRIQRIHAVARANPWRELAQWPQRILQPVFRSRHGEGRQRAVKQLIGQRRLADGTERIVVELQKIAHVTHPVRPQHIGRAQHHDRANLRKHHPADFCAEIVFRLTGAAGGKYRHREHRCAHAMRNHIQLFLCGCGQHVIDGDRYVVHRHILERPVTTGGGHARARAQVQDPHIALGVAQGLGEAIRHRAMGVGGAAGAVAVDQQHGTCGGSRGLPVAGQPDLDRRFARARLIQGQPLNLRRWQSRYLARQARSRPDQWRIGFSKRQRVNLQHHAQHVQHKRCQVDQRGNAVLLAHEPQQGHLLARQVTLVEHQPGEGTAGAHHARKGLNFHFRQLRPRAGAALVGHALDAANRRVPESPCVQWRIAVQRQWITDREIVGEQPYRTGA